VKEIGVLNDEEIQAIKLSDYPVVDKHAEARAIAQAQHTHTLQAVVEWLKAHKQSGFEDEKGRPCVAIFFSNKEWANLEQMVCPSP